MGSISTADLRLSKVVLTFFVALITFTIELRALSAG